MAKRRSNLNMPAMDVIDVVVDDDEFSSLERQPAACATRTHSPMTKHTLDVAFGSYAIRDLGIVTAAVVIKGPGKSEWKLREQT